MPYCGRVTRFSPTCLALWLPNLWSWPSANTNKADESMKADGSSKLNYERQRSDIASLRPRTGSPDQSTLRSTYLPPATGSSSWRSTTRATDRMTGGTPSSPRPAPAWGGSGGRSRVGDGTTRPRPVHRWADQDGQPCGKRARRHHPPYATIGERRGLRRSMRKIRPAVSAPQRLAARSRYALRLG